MIVLVAFMMSVPAFTKAQSVTYYIPLGQLLDCPNTCDGSNNSYYSACGAGLSPGFSWNDGLSGVAATSVVVDMGVGVDCDGATNTLNLNGVAQTTFTTTVDCQCIPIGTNGVRTFTLAGTNYNIGGSNNIRVTGNTSCFGYYNAAGIGGFARITVYYGIPCQIAAETNPLFTAASGCSNGTFRMGSGAYYNLAVAANTWYDFSWNNNGAPGLNGFCAIPQNGSGASFSSNQTGWFSGSTTVLRVGATRTSGTWNATSAIMTYRHTQPTAGTVVGSGANSTVCQGTTVAYDATGFSTGNFSYFEYQWNTTGGGYSGPWQTSDPSYWGAGLNGASILYVRSAITNNGCISVSPPVSTTVNAYSSYGTLSNAGPIDYCSASGDYGTAVSVSGYTGSPSWQWGSSNGGVNAWVSGAAAGTCCFPKKVSNSDGNPDRVRVNVTNGACPTSTSPWVLLRNRYNEAPSSLSSSASNYCANAVPGTITLTAAFPAATAILGTVEFATSCGGTPVASVAGNGTASVAATIAAPTSTTTYYVRYNPGAGSGCAPTACVSTTVTVTPLPTTANAGIDKFNCNSGSFTMTANAPSSGTGTWSVIGGTASVTTPGSATSAVTGVPAGTTATLRWTIANSPCASSFDDVVLTNYAAATTANAGVDKFNCNNGSFTMTGNAPSVGTGAWSVVGGTASITTPGSATSAVTGVPAGTTATLRWTITNGTCSSFDDVVLTNYAAATVAAAGVDKFNCNNGSFTMTGNAPSVGTGAWSVVGGTASVTTPGSATSAVTGVPAGTTATLRWTITNGTCSSFDDVVLTNYAAATVAAAGVDKFNCSNGTFTMTANTASVGTGAWSVIAGSASVTTPGSATSAVTGVAAGASATLRWTITNGTCSSFDDVVLTNYAAATVAAAGIDQNNCNNSNFTLAGNTAGVGTGAWSVVAGSASVTTPGSATSAVTGVAAGASATLRWTITNGTCSSFDDVVLTNYAAATVAAAGVDKFNCNNGSFTMTANTASVGTGAWSVIAGSASITTASSPTTTVTGVAAGASATLRWTITNGTCSSFDDVVLTNYAAATVAAAGIDQNNCNNSNFTLAGNTASVGTGAWSVVAGSASVTTPGSATSAVTGVAAGASATLRWTITNGTCSSFDDVVLTNYAAATVAAAGVDKFNCNNGSFTMTGNAPSVGTGAWSVVSGTASVTTPGSATSAVTGVPAGTTATLRWTITNGTCSSFDDVVLTNYAAATVAAAGIDQSNCNSGNFTLAGNTASVGTGAWSVVSGTATITTPSLATSGVTGVALGASATLRWTITNGTCSSFDDVVLTNTGGPTATAGNNINSCTGMAAIAMTGATATGTYSGTPTWTGGAGLGNWAQNANPALATFTPTTASGSFTATLTLTGSGGCSNATATRTITWNSSITGLTASLSANPVCELSDVNLTASVTTGTIATWSWSGPNSFSSASQNPTVFGVAEPDNEGVYTVSATNSCGTASASTAALNVHRFVIALTVNATPNPICEGSDLVLTATYAGAPLPSGDVSWNWSGPNSFTASVQDPTRLAVTPADGGIYEVSATNACGVQNAGGPSVQVDQQIIADADVNLLAAAGPDPDVIEACGTLVLNLQGNSAGTGIGEWSMVPSISPNTGTVSNWSDNTNNNVTVTYSNYDPLPVTFTWKITNGVCPPSESDVRVIFDPAINVTTQVAGCSFTSADSVMVQVSGSGGSGTLSYGAPMGGELRVDINANNKAFTVPSDGSSYQFAVSDAFCTASQSVAVPNGHPMDVAYSSGTGTMTATCYQYEFNKWTTYSDNNNNAILSINDNGQDLGQVSVSVYKDAAVTTVPQSQNADNCLGAEGTGMQRHFMLTASQAFSSPVGVRLYFTDAELQALITASQNNDVMGDPCSQMDNVYDLNDLYLTKYTGVNEDGDYSNNAPAPSGLYKVYGTDGADGSLTKSANGFSSVYSGGQQTNHYVQLSVSEFSEMWLHGSSGGAALPVEMLYLEANAINNEYIEVKWGTALEIDNNGFQVERSTDGLSWNAIGWVDGNNNTTTQRDYTYNDENVTPGLRYYYRLKQIDNDGDYEYTGIVSSIINTQVTFNVKDFVPNPAVAVTNLFITSNNEQEITVEVYNIIGEKVLGGKHGLSKGSNQIAFDLEGIAAGTYTAVVSSNNEVYSKKLMVIK